MTGKTGVSANVLDMHAHHKAGYTAEVLFRRSEAERIVSNKTIREEPSVAQQVQMAVEIGKDAARKEEERQPTVPKWQTAITSARAQLLAGKYLPSEPPVMIIASPYAVSDFNVAQEQISLIVNTTGETATVPVSNKIGRHSLVHGHARNPLTGLNEPVITSRITIAEQEPEPAKRQPKPPTPRERRREELWNGSLIAKAREAREKAVRGSAGTQRSIPFLAMRKIFRNWIN